MDTTTPTRAWSVTIAPSPAAPAVLDARGHHVATIHGPRAQAALDAVLLAHAPTMLAALHRCAETFQLMVAHDPGPSGQVAAAVLSQLEELLRGPLGAWEEGSRDTARKGDDQ